MDGQRRFAVIGTDARLAAAGRALARAGFAVGGPEQIRVGKKYTHNDICFPCQMVIGELIDAYKGAERSLNLRGARVDDSGHVVPEERTLQVKIPKGVKEGQLIRLAGQGSPGFNGGPAGDLLLEVQFRPDPRYRIDGRDVTQKLRVTPWEAALGGGVAVMTPDGATVEVTVPAGSGGGRSWPGPAVPLWPGQRYCWAGDRPPRRRRCRRRTKQNPTPPCPRVNGGPSG